MICVEMIMDIGIDTFEADIVVCDKKQPLSHINWDNIIRMMVAVYLQL